MADIAEYSTEQQKVIKQIIQNDKGFHSNIMIADMPFYGMLEQLDSGEYSVKKNVSCPLNAGGMDYELQLFYSEEQQCWFYLMKFNGDEIRGVVHYNTILNAMGELSFVILNDNCDDEDITASLPYSNVLVLGK
jgi:hypothetical protein